MDIDIGSLEFIDFPSRILIQDYKKSEQKFVDYFQCQPGVAAVYKIGSVNNPGISDLDLVLVLKNHIRNSVNFDFLKRMDSRIFTHPPFVISENLFLYLHYLFYANNLQRISGKEYNFVRPLLSSEYRQLHWILSTEAALYRLCDIVYQISCRNVLSMRNMLLKLSSIRHNVYLLGSIYEGKEKDIWTDYVDQINNLRNSWFSLRTDERLKDIRYLLIKSLSVLLGILDVLSRHSQELFQLFDTNEASFKTYFSLPNSLQYLKFISTDKSIIKIFHNPFSILNKLQGRIGYRILKHVNDISIITLPKDLLAVFLTTSSEPTNTEKRIVKNLTFRRRSFLLQCDQEKTWDLIRFRYTLLDDYHNFIINNNLSMLSHLAMASWLLSRKAKFYGLKKFILDGLLKLHII